MIKCREYTEVFRRKKVRELINKKAGQCGSAFLYS